MRTPVGDRYVVEHMREHGFNVGGEQSGHIILSDFSTTGDGLVAALQVLAVVVEQRQAGQRGLQPFRAAAADPGERPLQTAASRWSNVAVQQAIDTGKAAARRITAGW